MNMEEVMLLPEATGTYGNSTSQMAPQKFWLATGEDRKFCFEGFQKLIFRGSWLLVLGRVLTQHESEHRLQGDLF